MSESKARLEKHALYLAGECDRLEGEVVFLLQTILDLDGDYPSLKIAELLKDRHYPGRVWRQLSVPE